MFLNETPMRRAKVIRLHQQRVWNFEDDIGMSVGEVKRGLKSGRVRETYEICMLLMEDFVLQTARLPQ